MPKETETISIDLIEEQKPMHPLWLFVKIATALGIKEIEKNTKYESLVYRFEVFKTAATQEFCDALSLVLSINGESRNVPCQSGLMEISYICSKKNNECLCMKSFYKDSIYPNKAKKYTVPDINYFQKTNREYPDMEIHIYDNGQVWNFTKKDYRKPKGFPCSMKDFFYYQEKHNVEYDVFYALFSAWGEQYDIWKDLAEDFKEGTVYSSLPLDFIFSCRTRMEIIKKRYGVSWNRNNKETIGQGIFYARAIRLINHNDVQKLFGFNMFPCFIGREKKDMIKPLTYYIYEHLKEQFPEMKIVYSNKKPFVIEQSLISDAVRMSIDLKKKIPLTFHSLSRVRQWHDDLAVIHRNGRLPTVKIPAKSRFKNLTLPDDCIRFTKKSQFAEEGIYQHNCVTSYISSVNNDKCSIWSMRKPDGTRYTIEICIRSSKNNPDGFFYIQQMKGFGNSDVPREDYERVSECIKNQRIFKYMRL